MDWLDESLDHDQRNHRLRRPVALEPLSATTARLDGRIVTVFCGNDYLGLRHDRRLAHAAIESMRSQGSGAGASRLVSGNYPLHERAEDALARLVDRPAALLFSSGYAANLATLACLTGPGDVIFSDALNHASIVDGCRLSRAQVVVYPHRDVDALRERVRAHRPARRGWIVTESLFSMDGDVAPLAALRDVCRDEGLHLHVDDAHAVGIAGPRGAGLAASLGVVPDVLVGTLGKALGGSGAFVAGSPSLRLYLWNHARSFVFSTAVAPSVAAVALEAASLAGVATAERAALAANIARLHAGLRARGQRVDSDERSPIVPIVFGDDARAVAASRALCEAGYFVQAIRPPTVPVGTARLRVTVSAAHGPEAIDGLLAALAPLLP